MNWLYKLQRKCSRFRVENLMIYITVTMLAVYLADWLIGINFSGYLYFDRGLILRGQVWRLVTFVFLPPNTEPIFLLFSLYFYYFIGDGLEKAWGASQFTFYYACGVLGTIVAGFIAGSAGNAYLNLSLFFAFAHLYPDMQVRLFFILPLKIKYLAWVNWAIFAFSLIGALIRLDFASCASIIAPIINYLLFFGKDHIDSFRDWRRYGKQRRNFRRQTRNNPNDFWR